MNIVHHLSLHVPVLLNVCRGYHHLTLVCTSTLYKGDLVCPSLKILWYHP